MKLGGERKLVTILFADVRGFTGIAEALQAEPDKLTALINEILTPLSDIVIRNGGTIDKYIGDCLMAFWNAPLDDPRHAHNAVRAAEQMIDAVVAIDRDVRDSHLEGLQLGIAIGIGINTGVCVVGNMGSSQRFDYTVVGDPVNVASRLEALSKDYQVPLLIGGSTAGLTKDEVNYVELGEIRVRGKMGLETIHSIQSDGRTRHSRAW